ncbi:hypothetical protein BDR05DRAFT_342989 [Suillus weaverae]|nr:hypothetical protein BDR05DRAFT_342989 [Suillus weaverae]
MPSLPVKDFIKDFDLGKVLAVRLTQRCPTKNGRTQQLPATMATTPSLQIFLVNFPFLHPLHSDSSLLVHPGSMARDPGLEVSINISSARSSRGDSSARKASDVAQTFLPFVQAVAGPIPRIQLLVLQSKLPLVLLEIFKVMDVRACVTARTFLNFNVIIETWSE